jgi:ATP/maltotriose-dependent transcriptional regulator MalT
VSGATSGGENTADGGLVGRRGERAVLEAAWHALGGDATAILLAGEAGIGKSAIWESAVAEARHRGYRLLLARPAESEATLAFAGLGDILEGALDEIVATLPAPQARALAVALQRVDADQAADPLAVHRGALGVLRTLTQAAPLVIAIDDVQWLDSPSVAALTFALRRLRDAPLLIVVSLREPHADPLDLEGALPGHVQRVQVGPLDEASLHEVIQRRLGVVVPPPTMRSINERSAGNPFYAVELVRPLPVRGGRVVAERLELPDSLRTLIDDRLGALSGSTLSVVAAAGALGDPSLAVLERFDPGAAAALNVAEDARIVHLKGAKVRFDHPLLASGAIALLSASAQRDMHRRLAQVAPTEQERALHLAQSTNEPNEPDATALDLAAQHALERGAPHTAGELSEHAARLTPAGAQDDAVRRRRAAAGHFLVAGAIERGRQILTQLEHELPAGPERAAVLLLLADTDADVANAARRCEQARSEAEGDGACLAESLRLSSEFMMLAGQVPQALAVAREASQIATQAGDAVLLVRCLGTQSHYETYQGEITEGLLEDAVALEEATPGTSRHYSPTQIMGLRLMYSDRLDEARELLERILRRTEEHGDDLERTNLLLHLTQLEIRAGRWAQARQMANTALALDRQLGVQTDSRLFLQALVAAHLGREDEAREAARIALGLGQEQIHALWVVMARWALGLLELSLGNATAAADQLAPLPERLAQSGYRNPGVRPILPDAIEALIGVGRVDEATRWTRELADRGRELGNPWAIATAARCAGLIAAAAGDIDAARIHLHEALVAHADSPNSFERARTLLALGVVERRAKQWRVARETLTEALDGFDALGAALWSERTATEIARVQGRRSTGGLTATERHVADLVAGGMSNKQAAAALHVSVRAVEANLSRVYAKLGVRSRTELARNLQRGEDIAT